MAKKSEAKRAAWEVDFLNIELDSAQRKELEKWDVTGERSISSLEQLSLNGFKLSFTRDERNDCTIAAATSPKAEASGGRQYCFTARGPDLVGSMRALAYKLVVVLDGSPDTARTVEQVRSSWG